MRLRSAFLMMAMMAAGPAATAEVPVIGYRGDGTGVFPDDCKPVTTWKEFAGTREMPIADGKKTITVPDPGSKEVLENIVWKTPMPNFTESAPIAVGNRVFTLCEPGWPVGTGDAPSLVCVDGDTGKILWQQSIDQFEALPEAQRAEARQLRKEYWERQRLAFSILLRSQGLAAAKDMAGLDALSEEARKGGIERVADQLSDPKMRTKGLTLFAGQQGWGYGSKPRSFKQINWVAPLWHYTTMGMTFATPCSNGKLVFAPTGYGALAAFDLDGNRKWIQWFCAPGQRPPGKQSGDSASSPVLGQDGKMLVWRSSCSVLGVDAETGRIVWHYDFPMEDTTKPDGPQGQYFVGTGAILKVGEEEVFIHTHGLALRVRDGKVLADPLHESMKDMPHQSYVFDRERAILVWGVGGHCGNHKPPFTFAGKLALAGPDKLSIEIMWQKSQKEAGGYMDDATGVLYNGRIYLASDVVLDLMTGSKVGVISRDLERCHGVQVVDGHLWGSIHNESVVQTLAPIGPDGSVGTVIGNSLEHAGPYSEEKLQQMAGYGSNRKGKWYHWATSRGYPFFSGNRVFIRTFDHLYCIGDKTKPFVPSKAFAAQ